MLSMIGFEVIFAIDGEEAIELYRSTQGTSDPVDLIIMDLTIPGGMGGKEAVQKIHQLNSDAKVIVSSGYSNDPIMANYQEFGFCAAIGKPFTFADLKQTIFRVMS
jgi:two-component system cell cycle sensor histidine kinase/response regulator CckA